MAAGKQPVFYIYTFLQVGWCFNRNCSLYYFKLCCNSRWSDKDFGALLNKTNKAELGSRYLSCIDMEYNQQCKCIY